MNRIVARLAACTIILGLSILGLPAVGEEVKKPSATVDQLSLLLKVAAPVPNPWAGVTDPLKSDQRKAAWPAFVVPKALCDLLKGEAVIGGRAACRFRAPDGRPRWEWSLDATIKGAGDIEVANVVNKRLLDRAAAARFEASEGDPPWSFHTKSRDDPTRVMRRAIRSDEEVIAFTPVLPHFENGFIEMCWSVQSRRRAPVPTYAELVRVLPCMEVRHDGDIPIPDSVLGFLRSRQVSEACIYGSGTTYYGLSLSVVVDPNKEKGPASLKGQLMECLRTEGFPQQRLSKPKPGEVEFFKWSPSTRESSCQATLQPSENELLVSLTVQLDVKKQGR